MTTHHSARPIDFNTVLEVCHQNAQAGGWWSDYDRMPEEYKKYVIGTKIALIHSEISEAMEGARKGLPDSHLPHLPALDVELADAVIRIFDLCGKLNIDLLEAIEDKLYYNKHRADHKVENRAAAGGKSF
jgi:NTP pyrophosphatase (non-canonical NTP hydrolase)